MMLSRELEFPTHSPGTNTIFPHEQERFLGQAEVTNAYAGLDTPAGLSRRYSKINLLS